MDAAGAVRSIQAADLTMPAGELIEIWDPTHLERLARTYWKYLSRVTLGLIRVEYTATERAVVLLHRPLVLLRFKAPDYNMGDGRGIVRWTIRDGILVARPGRSGDGYLEIDVRRCPAEEPGYEKVHVEVEVANFYPALATWVARWSAGCGRATTMSARRRSRRDTTSGACSRTTTWCAATTCSSRPPASPTATCSRAYATRARAVPARSRS